MAPNIDETAFIDEQPEPLSLRLAKEKALAIQSSTNNSLIIASDQVASCDNKILGKPENHKNTIQQLKFQSDKKVSFYTSICVLDTATGILYTDIDICTVHFKKLSDQQIFNYVEIDKPYDCAGGFKSEGLGIALFDKIEGEDPNALVGLPLIKLIRLLNKFDIKVL